MPKLGGTLRDPEFLQGLVERELPRGGWENILTAKHMRNAHECVVDRINERVQRGTIGSRNHVVGLSLRGEGDLPSNHALPCPGPLRHLEPPHGFASLGLVSGDLILGEVTVVIVITQVRIAACRLVTLLHLLVGGKRRVNVARLFELLQHVKVNIHALRLAVGLVRTSLYHPFVPVKTEPRERIDDRLVALLRIASSIGVLNAENQLASGVPGVAPVKKGRADHAHVGRAGRRRTETNAYIRRGVNHGERVYPHACVYNL